MKNREFWGVNLRTTSGVLFEECIFRGNRMEGALFSTDSCSDIVVKGGEIAANRSQSLTDNPTEVSFLP